MTQRMTERVGFLSIRISYLMKLLPIPFDILVSGLTCMRWVTDVVESLQPFVLGFLTEKKEQSLSVSKLHGVISRLSFFWDVNRLKCLVTIEEILKLSKHIFDSYFEVITRWCGVFCLGPNFED